MRSKKNSINRGAARFAGVTLGATLCASAFLCTQAQAADRPAGVPDYQGARQVLQSSQVHDTVNRFLNAANSQGNAGADGGQEAEAPLAAGAHDAPQSFSLKDPVAMYEITPDFVTGKAKPTSAGALRLSYLASEVNGANGHRATALLAGHTSPAKGQKWHLTGIQDGNADIGYAKQATSDSTVFSEPQIHAWYRLRHGTVQPLNREAVSGFGGKRAMSLTAYQKLVHGRYADKLPGSAYDRKGLAGGYKLAAPAHHAPSSTPMLLGGSGALALALAGGTFGVRAHRKRMRSQTS
ncbi:hypothetical protein ADL29_10890 [Streptomyces chattanoogensis]|uniref:Uncharacterized protein n=1 Tax=Streptomyces chattanoogensis TaxID=66876 RepID=A0A0N0H1Z8_9ACTN|nr:hypothetical protein ADL29_10890 [Streptomyces chattanoogensis]